MSVACEINRTAIVIADDKPDNQREGRDHLEINQRPAANSADPAHVAHLGDADRHRGENDQRHDGADKHDEAVAERLHIDGKAGQTTAEQDAERDRDQHLHIKFFNGDRAWAPRLARSEISKRELAM